jgi:hypothetical protein
MTPVDPGHDDDVHAAAGYAINHPKENERAYWTRCVAVLLSFLMILLDSL